MKGNFFKKDVFILLVFLSLISILILSQIIQNEHPIGNDAYFHYFMSKLILENNFHLPEKIPYFWDGIKFGYPPLLHYMCAFFGLFFPLIEIFRILPLILLISLLISIYFAFKDSHPVLGIMIFLMIPLSLMFLYTGVYGRPLGFIFLFLLIWALKTYTKSENKNYLIASSLFFGMAILSHLTTGIMSFFIILYFLIKLFHEKRDYKIIYVFSGVLFALPWLLTIFGRYGIFYFLDVLSMHSFRNLSILSASIGFAALIYDTYKNKIPNLLTLLFFFSCIFFSYIGIIASVSLILAKILSKKLKMYRLKNISILLIITLIVFSIYFPMILKFMGGIRPTINPMESEALKWIKNDSDINKAIVIYSDAKNLKSNSFTAFIDTFIVGNEHYIPPTSHIPILTERKTYTSFAFEWDLDKKRKEFEIEAAKLPCARNLRKAMKEYNVTADYLWFDKGMYKDCVTEETTNSTLVFENKRIKIFKLN
ncbi:MAG: hypothetical protein J7L08_01715 [Candidatus Aenigmarchaeota archaeon]|nr:hypothetical protein [Candidatus Aenigmarchaeota archaeon]